MPDNAAPSARPDYPDVLGAIAGGPRHVVGVVQCAFAAYPRAAVIGQPFEALVLLQNCCDQPVQVAVSLQLPKKDTQGKRISLVTPKDVLVFMVQPAELGLLHMPLVPHLPTQPAQGNPLGVKIEVRPPKSFNLVRLLQGGRPPAMLNLSPARLNIMREIGFNAVSPEAGVLTTTFDAISSQYNSPAPDNVQPRYETLWGMAELAQERAKYAVLQDKAQRFARIFMPTNIIDSMIAVTARRYNQAGLPLQPGESLAISKALIYAMVDGADKNFSGTDRRWFQQLAINIEDDALTGDLRKLIAVLYSAIAHDAVRMGLNLVERVSGENLGSSREHIAFADEMVAVLDGQSQGGLVHIYLPLGLVGLLLNGQINGPRENPWTSLAQIEEGWKVRAQVADAHDEFLFNLLSRFTDNAEQFLIKNRVPRPR